MRVCSAGLEERKSLCCPSGINVAKFCQVWVWEVGQSWSGSEAGDRYLHHLIALSGHSVCLCGNQVGKSNLVPADLTNGSLWAQRTSGVAVSGICS